METFPKLEECDAETDELSTRLLEQKLVRTGSVLHGEPAALPNFNVGWDKLASSAGPPAGNIGN